MKKCPQCGREYDHSMSFCLDDGVELLYGPASDEPPTAILHTTDAPSEAATSAQIHTTDQTGGLPSGIHELPRRRFDNRLLAAPFLLAIIVFGAYFGYRYFRQDGGQISSIAVMPFVNEGGNADIEYLTDGMTDTLIASLSQVPNLSVKAHTSVFRYKGKDLDPKKIASDLGVQAVLVGRVAQRGDDLRLTVELIDANSEDVLWANRYEKKTADIVTLQSQLTNELTSRLRLQRSGSAPPVAKYSPNPAAYQLYLQGLYHWNKRTTDSLKKAAEEFQKAAEADPAYAEAYAGLALTYAVMPSFNILPAKQAYPLAKTTAERALKLDDGSPGAHAALAMSLARGDCNFLAAEREFKRAIEIDPNYATAHQWYASSVLRYLGRFDESIAEGEKARELDPLSPIIAVNSAENYRYAGRPDQAFPVLQKAIDIEPSFFFSYTSRGYAYEQLGRYSEAFQDYQHGLEMSGDLSYLADVARMQALMGRRDEALRSIEKMKQSSSTYITGYVSVAVAFLALGDNDKASEHLEKAYNDGDCEPVVGIALDPNTDPKVRNDPRIVNLLKRMGLPVEIIDRR